MTARVVWTQGGEAEVLAASAEAIRLSSTVSSPPGSRIEGTVVGVGETTATLRVKVHVCKRQDDGSFLLEGRPIDLKRDVRAALEKACMTVLKMPL